MNEQAEIVRSLNFNICYIKFNCIEVTKEVEVANSAQKL